MALLNDHEHSPNTDVAEIDTEDHRPARLVQQPAESFVALTSEAESIKSQGQVYFNSIIEGLSSHGTNPHPFMSSHWIIADVKMVRA